jgi:hypothetical protein
LRANCLLSGSGLAAFAGSATLAAPISHSSTAPVSHCEVYISPSHKNDWGKDRMGDYTLENGKARLFKFSDKSACMQDIKVVFDDDESEVIWEEIDLCEINKITLKYNRKTRVVSADTE